MKTSKTWTIIQWVFGGFILLLALVAFSTKGGILSGLLFLLFAILVSPLRKKIFGLLPATFPKKIVAILSGVVLFFASFITFPSSGTTQTAEDTVEEVVERSMPLVESTEEGDKSNIKSLYFSSSKDIDVQEGKAVSDGYVLAQVNDKDSFSEDDVTFVSSNPEIATIEYKNTALSNYLYYTINGISAGETEVYAVSKDGKVESEHKKVIVKVDEEKLAKEKEEAEKLEAEKKAAEEAQKKAEEETAKKAEEEKQAKEKAEAEAKAASETKSTTEQAATTAVAVVPQQIETSSGSSTGGGGNGDNFNTYDIPEQQNTEETYVLNTSSHKFHKPSCKDVKKIKPENYATTSASREELISQQYEPCGHCNP